MAKERFLRGLELVRRDVGSLLFHWTRQITSGGVLFDETPPTATPAPVVLRRILKQRQLIGGTGFIKGGSRCVCFTEMPISEVAAMFRLSQAIRLEDRPRYEPFGVAVKKDWLYRKGGRPVIYQSDGEYDLLPDLIKWRHVQYDPTVGIDFTWEREWRIKTDILDLEPDATLVVVPSVSDAHSLRITLDSAGQTEHESWMVLSLDFFGVTTETTKLQQ